MFHRVTYEAWTAIIPVVSFWILFIIFVAATIRSLVMKKGDAARMAALPLDDQPPARQPPRQPEI
jgi:hypothetical protein